MKDKSRYISKLSRAKGLGPAHHGVSHWWAQRLTAIALIPLGVWFVYAILAALLFPSPLQVADWLASPVNAILMTLMIITMFWHARLGLQVIIEDYIKCPYSKYGLLIGNNFACLALTAMGIMAVLKLHFLDIVASTL